MVKFNTLGSWNSDGTPDYLAASVYLNPNTIARVRDIVPGHAHVDPKLISKNAMRDILLIHAADVYVTFVWEGAGFKNALSFYTFPIDPENGILQPTSRDQWNDTYTIIFPNCSRLRGGGKMSPGMRVRIGSFPANTGIGFMLMPNGWEQGTKTVATSSSSAVGAPIFTDAQFNTADQYVQSIAVMDPVTYEQYIFFEDIMRPAGDEDFSDLIVKVSSDPSSAIMANTNTLYGEISETNGILFANNTGLQHLLTSDQTSSVVQNGVEDDIYQQKIIFSVSTIREEFKTLAFNAAQSITWNGANVQVVFDKPSDTITVSMEVSRDIVIHSAIIVLLVSDNAEDDTAFDNLMRFEQLIITEGVPTTTKIINMCTGKTDAVSTATNFGSCSPRLFGDPHIRTVHGEHYNFTDEPGVYVLYHSEARGILTELRGEFGHAKEYEHSTHEVYRTSTFLQKVSIWHANRRCLLVDIPSMRVSGDDVHILHAYYNWETSVIEKEYGPETQTVYIDLRALNSPALRGFECAYLPHIEGHLTEIRLDISNNTFIASNGCMVSDFELKRETL
jgi:hypothetical protein